ncbi:MAG: DUF2461 domain-containing protein [Bacteroidota bacterium]|nr:DUF2461 domain-containing protein [Bacteroidota bacterium]
MLHPSTLTFLKDLKKNNNKVWFDENREKYISAKNNFEEFVNELLHKMISFDLDMKELEAKNCMFRINRDIRFSKDKTPYKINLSASFNKGGKKSINAGYYFHLQPGGNSFAGGGLWMPAAPELKKLRQEIDYCFPEFKKIISNTVFKKQYGELEREKDQMLVNVPKGYDKENPAGDFLKLKSFVATKKIPDSALLLQNLSGEILKAFKVLMPFVKFMNRAFE